MYKLKPQLYLIGATLIPMIALAHGGVDDGDEEAVVADPAQRGKVMIAVGIMAFLLVAFFWYAKKKNAPAVPPVPPAPSVPPTPPETPTEV